MKTKLLFFFVAIFFPLFVMAQNVELTKKHAGVLYVGSYNKNFNILHSSNVWFGGEITLNSEDGNTSFIFRGIYKSDGNFGQFYLNQRISQSMELLAGYMGRPIAFLNRPTPLEGQFEPGALRVIPGSATGVILKQQYSRTSYLTGGIYYIPQKGPEIDMGIKIDEGSVGGMYNSGIWDVAGTYKIDALRCTAYHNSEKINSFFCEVRTSFCNPYAFVIYNRGTKSSENWEFGFTKTFSIKNSLPEVITKALVGLGYNGKTEMANIYFWLYFE